MGTASSRPRESDSARFVRMLRHDFLGDRSAAIYSTLGAHVVDAATGGVLFWGGVSLAQLVQYPLRIGAATPLVPKMIGAAAVAGSSILALHGASLPRELWTASSSSVSKSRGKAAASFSAQWLEVRQRCERRVETLQDAPCGLYAVMGLVCFAMLGGRWSALAPSHYAHLGAFHQARASLPATAEYATTTERGVIQELGRLFGCHTCGVRRGVRYNADHMPPKIVAQHQDQALLRRIFKRKTSFRFYPQCESCSNHQSSVVKTGRQALKTHFFAPRLYHSTGIWLVLLCTGGLYAGSSAFQEQTDLISKETLLRSLREREHELLRQRYQTRKGIERDEIDEELQAISDCKSVVKGSWR